jgi:Lrp/AsnC family leucine-responsive transcriptional regulator
MDDASHRVVIVGAGFAVRSGAKSAVVVRGVDPERYVAIIDPRKVGLPLTAFVNVKLEKRGRMPTDAFARAVKDWPEVLGCHSLTGDMDYLLHVAVADLEHFSRFLLDKLLSSSGVADVNTSFVLRAVKQAQGLPLKAS